MTFENPPPNPGATRFQIRVLNRQRRYRVFDEAVAALCEGVLAALNERACALDVVFVGGERMRALNRDYRGRDYATDVLSFQSGGEIVDGFPWLGEIVVAPRVAEEHARRWKVSPDAEIRRLVLHGILHILGHDHESDGGEMFRLQARLARRSFFRRAAPAAVLMERR